MAIDRLKWMKLAISQFIAEGDWHMPFENFRQIKIVSLKVSTNSTLMSTLTFWFLLEPFGNSPVKFGIFKTLLFCFSHLYGATATTAQGYGSVHK